MKTWIIERLLLLTAKIGASVVPLTPYEAGKIAVPLKPDEDYIYLVAFNRNDNSKAEKAQQEEA